MRRILALLGDEPLESQILRLQLTINLAFSSGSLTAGAINLGALALLNTARKTVCRFIPQRCPAV